MKRYFLKILISATAILFAINVFTLASYAQEAGISVTDEIQGIYATDNNTQGYEIVKDENGYKAVLKNPEPEGAGLSADDKRQATGDSVIGRADLDNYVKLLIPEKSSYISGLVFNYKYYYSTTSYRYSSYNKCVQYREMNDAQTITTITVGEFDWSLADSYIITIDTLHGIYKTEITQYDLTSEITLSMDSTYTEPSLSVPFDLLPYDNFGFDFLVYDEQGKFITNYYVNEFDMINGYKIPSGHYKVQAFGEGSSNSFNLLKNDYYLTPSTQTITFSSNDIAKVSFNLGEGNSTGTQLIVTNTIFMNESFNTMYSVEPSYSDNNSYIYVTKCNYKFASISTRTSGTGWGYGFTENEVDVSAGPLTINYDLNFKTQFIKPTSEIYGRSSLGQFKITNNNGQSVSISSGYSDQTVQTSSVIKLTRGSESFTFNNPYSTIMLPNPSASGTFTVDFSAFGPIAVTPTKDSIYINRLNALADDATLNYIVPASMNEGQKNYILITARNTGTNVWNSAGGYKLVAAGGSDPVASTLSYPIPDGVTIKENQEYEFVIPITAPTRGIYTSDWQMMKGNTAFGDIIATEIIVRSVQNPYKAIPISITSISPDKASPQPTGTKIRWTCNITGGTNPVYYFKIFKGSTLVKSSTAYAAANYFDWTPTEAGTDYRAYVYVKENGAASSTAVTKFSSYFTVKAAAAPIAITSLVPDKASPQTVGTPIRWTCNITGGTNPVYYFKIFKGSTLVKSSTAYASTNYFDWTPAEAGTDYRAMVYVKENGAVTSSAVTKTSSYYTITTPAPIAITSVVPDKASPQTVGTPIRWTCNITGGTKPEYYFKIFKGSTLVKSSTAYAAANYFDWTPTEAGTDYRAYVYVKENGAATSTAVTKSSSYFTVKAAAAPIAITSVAPDKASPQTVGTPIRWTCNITGGTNPIYYFKIFKGSTLVKSSTAYASTNYFDWTPAEAGTDYRAYVYVKENGSASSTAVAKFSSYFTVNAAPAPIAITSLEPNKTSPQAAGTTIRWTCNITGGIKPVYSFKVFDGSTLLQSSPAFSTTNYIDWTAAKAGNKYRVMVYVKENGASTSTAVTKLSEYFTVN